MKKKKEMAGVFGDLAEYALTAEVTTSAGQLSLDGKKLVEIALRASASTFAFCSCLAEGSIPMPSGGFGEKEQYASLASILQFTFEMDAEDSE